MILIMKEQKDIKSTFEVLLKLENKRYLLIPHLARELKVNKIDLTQYILDNPKLFHCENTWSYKEVKVKRRLWANDPKSAYLTTDYVKNKNLGWCVHTVYLNAVDNFRTDEWLNHQIESMGKYIYISEMDNYGYIQGYYINTDVKPEKPADEKYRFWAWRNTQAKVSWLKGNGFTHEGSSVFGGLGDSYNQKFSNVITLDKINELKALGWSTNNFNPLSK